MDVCLCGIGDEALVVSDTIHVNRVVIFDIQCRVHDSRTRMSGISIGIVVSVYRIQSAYAGIMNKCMFVWNGKSGRIRCNLYLSQTQISTKAVPLSTQSKLLYKHDNTQQQT